MLLAFLLAALLQAPPAEIAPSRSGSVVLCGESFELPETLARELAGGAAHLVLDFEAGEERADPLAKSGTPLVQLHLDGTWNDERERELCGELDRTRAVVLRGGHWIDWWNRLRPLGKASRFEQELCAAQRGGRTLLGTGAGAAWLASWPLVSREELHKPPRNPRRQDPDLVVRGLGLLENWMVDTSEQSPQGAERLLASAQHFGAAHALYLCGPTAWIVRESGRSVEVAGAGASVVFDLARARRSRAELCDARLARLGAGDRARLAPEFAFRIADSGPRPATPRALGSAPPEFWTPEALATLTQGFECSFDWRGRAGEQRR